MRVRMELRAKIRRDARVEGLSIRGLAKRYQIGRDTVRQALSDPVPPARKTPSRSSPWMDQFKAAIGAMLTEDTTAPRVSQLMHVAVSNPWDSRRVVSRQIESDLAAGAGVRKGILYGTPPEPSAPPTWDRAGPVAA
jgi:hypothetical protein